MFYDLAVTSTTTNFKIGIIGIYVYRSSRQ